METISYDKHSVFTGCNSDCFCSASDWDPICGEDGITYVSPCLAGCTSSAGSGKNTVSSRGTNGGTWPWTKLVNKCALFVTSLPKEAKQIIRHCRFFWRLLVGTKLASRNTAYCYKKETAILSLPPLFRWNEQQQRRTEALGVTRASTKDCEWRSQTYCEMICARALV